MVSLFFQLQGGTHQGTSIIVMYHFSTPHLELRNKIILFYQTLFVATCNDHVLEAAYAFL